MDLAAGHAVGQPPLARFPRTGLDRALELRARLAERALPLDEVDDRHALGRLIEDGSARLMLEGHRVLVARGAGR